MAEVTVLLDHGWAASGLRDQLFCFASTLGSTWLQTEMVVQETEVVPIIHGIPWAYTGIPVSTTTDQGSQHQILSMTEGVGEDLQVQA